MWGVGCRIQGVVCIMSGVVCGVQGVGLKEKSTGFDVWGSGLGLIMSVEGFDVGSLCVLFASRLPFRIF